MSIEECFYYGDCPFDCECSVDDPHAKCINRTTDPRILMKVKDDKINELKKQLKEKEEEIIVKDAIIENLESRLYGYEFGV